MSNAFVLYKIVCLVHNESKKFVSAKFSKASSLIHLYVEQLNLILQYYTSNLIPIIHFNLYLHIPALVEQTV